MSGPESVHIVEIGEVMLITYNISLRLRESSSKQKKVKMNRVKCSLGSS